MGGLASERAGSPAGWRAVCGCGIGRRVGGLAGLRTLGPAGEDGSNRVSESENWRAGSRAENQAGVWVGLQVSWASGLVSQREEKQADRAG